MLDNYGANIERIVRLQNANVNKIAYPQIVKDDFQRDREKKHDSFDDEINKAKNTKKKKSIDVEATKESVGSEVIIDSSLNKKINEHRVISQLVTEKFVNNPSLQGKIEFEETTSLANRIHDLLTESNEDKKIEIKEDTEPVSQSASDVCIQEIEKVMKKLGES